MDKKPEGCIQLRRVQVRLGVIEHRVIDKWSSHLALPLPLALPMATATGSGNFSLFQVEPEVGPPESPSRVQPYYRYRTAYRCTGYDRVTTQVHLLSARHADIFM